ncbi:MAG: hypothetical protein K2K74_10990 [Lachnospiraceae bacterium]|nr:hypothetical protein [Lachnospiraceae bacterium]
MNKRNLFSILFRETAISYGIVVIIGIFAGFLFFKLAELVLVNIMDRQVNYRVYVDWKGALAVLVAFAAIYLLILLNTLWQIHTNNPIALLHRDSEGERPLQSRNFLTVLGSVRVEIPVERMGEELSGKPIQPDTSQGLMQSWKLFGKRTIGQSRRTQKQMTTRSSAQCILPICWRCLSTGSWTLAGTCAIHGLRRGCILSLRRISSL